MARTLAVAALPALLVAVGWLRLEEPRAAGIDWLLVGGLALATALPARAWLRVALVAPATLTALWLAFDSPPTDERAGFFAPVFDRFVRGVAGFYDVTVPFAAADHRRMHGVLLVAIFVFSLALAQAVAARRPLPALLALIAGAGWPATLLPTGGLLYGTAVLAAALWLLAGLWTTRPVPALLAGAAIVLAAAGAATTSAVAKEGVVPWQEWSPGGVERVPVSVSYVWEANYGGIEFPKKPTTVLRITGPERGLYWRATTLDQFEADRWIEDPTLLTTDAAPGLLPEDALLPERAANPRTWVRQEVEVVALRETRIVAAAQPVRLDAAGLGEVFGLEGGLFRVPGGLERGQTYTVHSYAPRPGPKQLAEVEADYPPELDRYLRIGRTQVDAFGVPGRDRLVDGLFDDERYLALWPYRVVWEEAQRLRAGARTPYGAVVAIETWLRSTGGFEYDETPPPNGGLPPLAAFVERGRAGYCQQFAGAMALMLRFLGIPARVAAGFTSGKFEDGGWTVSDTNAHAWVEAWFPGYGWLSFDPTPGRGALAATYSASSTGFNVGDAAEAFGGRTVGAADGGAGELGRLLALKEQLAGRSGAGAPAEDRSLGTFWALVLVVLAAVVAIWIAKLVRRRARYLTRDPRRLAGAARLELVDFLADQGIAVDPSATADDLRELVRLELGVDARPFAGALARARFGPPGGSRSAADEARRELRALLRVLRSSLGRPARLRGLLRLSSLRA